MARKKRTKSFEQKQKGIDHDLNNAEHAIKKDDAAEQRKDFRRRDNKARKDSKRESIPRTKYGNDPIWYGLNPQLLKDAGSLSFNNPTGLPLDDVVSTYGGNGPMVIPGIATINYLPGIGISRDNASAVNVAARRLYTFVRHANAGSANYDSPDLMLYCISVASAVVTYTQMVRAYGVANVYSQKNRYMPDAILTALGFNSEDVRQNLADFRYAIGVASAKLNSLAVPGNIYYFARQAWLVSGLYLDNPGAKAQMYAFKPAGYYVYNEKDSAQGSPGSCTFKYYGADPFADLTTFETDVEKIEAREAARAAQSVLTIKQWNDILQEQLAALLESEDIGIMAGDILKAYGAQGLLSIPSITEDYIVVPQYDMEVLTQINNASFVKTRAVQQATFNIVQDASTGAILYNPHFKAATSDDNDPEFDNLRWRKILNVRSEDPTPEDVMVATRLCPDGSAWFNKENKEFILQTAGTEIPFEFRVFAYSYASGTPSIVSYDLSVFYQGLTDSMSTAMFRARRMAAITRFDWHPIVPLVIWNATERQRAAMVGDIDNYTTISSYEFKKLHETALLSLFNVPPMAQAYK